MMMRARFVLAGMVGALALCASAPVASAAEFIESFESDIAVQEDGSLDITETIHYNFGEEERHGIFRHIPTTHVEESSTWYTERVVDIEVKSVTRNGTEEPYHSSNERGWTKLQIGDADATLSGDHTYVIDYTLRGALMYPQQLPPEIYLDINGVGWDVPMKVVRATLRGNGIAAQRSCYKGVVGSGTSCVVRANSDGSIYFEAALLGPNETMTIANELTLGSVEKLIVERLRLSLISILCAVCWLLGFLWYTYRYRTAYLSGRTTIPQYEPFPGVLPLQIGVLQDGSLDPKDIAAAIVYLAEQGHLHVRKTERKVLFFFEVDDFEIELVRELPPGAPEAHREIMAILFTGEPHVGSVVALSSLKSDTQKQHENHARVQDLEKKIIADLTSTGFYQGSSQSVHTFQWILWGSAGLFFVGLFFMKPPLWYVVTLLTLVISGIIATYLTRRLTPQGDEALWHTHGFSEYLSVAEKDRLDFHNAPERKPEQFLAFLPYAIAFGVEEKWAEAFKDIVIPEPTWYQGGSPGSFSAAGLSTSLGGFSSALASSAGSSASSGGGSAGGGTGGGGGGSW